MLLLLLLLREDKPRKVSIHITFEAPNGENTSLDELNDFLNAVSKLHEQVIFSTQPEYLGSSKLSQILDYHQLEVEHICRKNPFDIILTFHIVQEGLITYWPFIKALIKFCKRYGKNSNQLEFSLENLRDYIIELFENLHRPGFLSRFSSKLRIFDNSENLLSKMNENLFKLLTNKSFRFYYDHFCTTAITITDFVSTIEKINNIDKCDFLKD